MPGKMARSDPRPPFELLEVKVAVRTSRLFCRKAGKTRIFSPVQESSGESRLKQGQLSPLDALPEGENDQCLITIRQ
jgi:hypothetical protein